MRNDIYVYILYLNPNWCVLHKSHFEAMEHTSLYSVWYSTSIWSASSTSLAIYPIHIGLSIGSNDSLFPLVLAYGLFGWSAITKQFQKFGKVSPSQTREEIINPSRFLVY